MNLINNLNRLLIDTDYKMIIKNHSLNIINYEEIKDFSDERIKIQLQNGLIIIKGENLVVSKMQDNEVLITGKIKIIEL